MLIYRCRYTYFLDGTRIFTNVLLVRLVREFTKLKPTVCLSVDSFALGWVAEYLIYGCWLSFDLPPRQRNLMRGCGIPKKGNLYPFIEKFSLLSCFLFFSQFFLLYSFLSFLILLCQYVFSSFVCLSLDLFPFHFPSSLHFPIFSFLFFLSLFLVACTRLYDSLCPSVGLLVCRSVSPSNLAFFLPFRRFKSFQVILHFDF